MPAFLARLMASQRGREFVSTLGVMLAVIVVVALVGLLARCTIGEKVDQAVAVDRADAVAEAAARVRAADAEIALNYAAEADQLANEQQELSREKTKGDDRGVGPGTIAVLERLRQQQVAR
jgi:Tfp pilus assembly protein PilX